MSAAREGGVRLQKWLATAGIASRRGAEAFLKEGRVTVNGRVAHLGDRADPSCDVVAVDGEPLARQALEYWILNKPRGVVTTVTDPEGRRTVLDLLPRDRRSEATLFPVGRLDRETQGLVLVTNDGALAQALLHPSFGNEREYRVTVRGELGAETIRRIERGVVLEGSRTAPARVAGASYDESRGVSRFRLVLTQGRKRQIRLMMQALGYPVKRLVRTRLGPLKLGALPIGSCRPLTSDEVQALQRHAERLRRAAEGRKPVSRGRRRGG
ncbi:MAG: pseudouridine synthase [Myxococcota bacterium]